MRPTFGPPVPLALAAALLLLLLLLGGMGVVHRRQAGKVPAAVLYSPSPAAPRPGPGRLLAGVHEVTDFERWADTIAVLDGAGRQVAVYAPGSQAPARVFGAPGGGPGELRRPTSLTLLPDGRLAVVDLPALHVFQREGTYLESFRPALPCSMNAARMRHDATGVYLSGNCTGGPGAADTLFAAVLHSHDLTAWTLVAREARMTVDGRWGSIYTPIEAFGEGVERHFFGLGLRDCLLVLEPVPGDAPATHERCGVAPEPYSIPEPAGRAAARRPRGPAFDWPDPMVRWLVVAEAAGAPVVGRAFSVDSLTLHAAAAGLTRPPMDLLVADGEIVTCRRGYCLWRTAEDGGVRVHLHDLTALGAASQAREAGT